MFWLRAAPGRSRLLLHVGRHKTGSTSLQQALAQVDLQPFAILYPQAGRLQDQHAQFPAELLTPPGLAAAEAAVPPEAERRIASLLEALEQEVRAARPRLILLSSEVFCELAKRQPQRCQWLLDQFASRWSLQLLQVVRPLPDFFLSALRHQLRAGTFASRSPFSWYRHCRQKTQILDSFWLASGYPVITLPYSSHDSSRLVFDSVADCAGLRLRKRRQLLARLPQLRANAGHQDAAVVALYFLYLVRTRAWQVERARSQAAPDLLSLQAFEAGLATADAALLNALRAHGVGDRDLLQLCCERDRALVASGSDSSAEPQPGDSAVDRLSDWDFLRASELYRRLRVELAQACCLLGLPHPEG